MVLAGTEQSSRQAATRLGLNLMKGQAHCFLFLRVRPVKTQTRFAANLCGIVESDSPMPPFV